MQEERLYKSIFNKYYIKVPIFSGLFLFAVKYLRVQYVIDLMIYIFNKDDSDLMITVKIMSFEKRGKMYIISCDICGAELPAVEDYYEALLQRKQAEWKKCKTGGEYFEDWCVDCFDEN